MTQMFGTRAANSAVDLINLGRWGGSNSQQLAAPGGDFVDYATAGTGIPRLISEVYIANMLAGWERLRSATHARFGQGAAITGNVPIWTPTAGKRFRLMAYRLALSGKAALAVAAEVIFFLTDGGALPAQTFEDGPIQIPAAAGTGPTLYVSPWHKIPGNGYLSSAANNVLAVSSNAAGVLTAGSVSVLAVGTEE